MLNLKLIVDVLFSDKPSSSMVKSILSYITALFQVSAKTYRPLTIKNYR